MIVKMLERLNIKEERYIGKESEGIFVLSDTIPALEKLIDEYEGKIKTIYMDPPYRTGERFCMRVRVGEKDWRSGNGSLKLETFADDLSAESYYSMMRNVLTICRKLLREDGMLFLHVDYRTHAYLRVMCDEIFDESNFVNEIIWCYQTGGRSTRHFSRKHDVILFYRKSKMMGFDLSAVMVQPDTPRSNHMKRHVDPDGRVYRSIKSGGKVYTYYDDEPIAPSDVWDDVSHLQQRDPERTGYETQKPLALLNRIIRCSAKPGDIVLDPFAGSSTTLESAKLNKCNFIGIDRTRLTLNIARRRLSGSMLKMYYPESMDMPNVEAVMYPGIGFYQVELTGFIAGKSDCDILPGGFDAIEAWSAGYVKDGIYTVHAESIRTRREPELKKCLEVPVYSGQLAINICTITGNSYCFAIENG